MSISVTEKFDSRYTSVGSDPTQERRYSVVGTNDEYTARLGVFQESPVVVDLYLDQSVMVWRQSIDMEPVGGDIWEGTVRYTTVKPTNESTISFDTSGGTAHITQSIGTVTRYATPTQLVAPDYKGAIGVTSDSIEGTDIVVPIYQWSETHYLPPSIVTAAYRAVIYALSGKVNSSTFRDYPAGEVLFLGATGTTRAGGDWEITYRFASTPNATGIVVGLMDGIVKEGWDYLWVRYEDQEDTAAKALVKVPMAAYVERVYYRADLNNLGI